MPISSREAAEQNALYVAMAMRLLRRADAFSPGEYWGGGVSSESSPVAPWKLATFKLIGQNPIAESGRDQDCESGVKTGEVPKAVRVRAFLDRVYELSDQQQFDDGIELIIEQLDNWLRAGHIDMCEGALAMADPTRLQEDLTFSFLTATLAARRHIQSQSFQKQRARYFDRAKKRIAQLRGVEFSNKLLARYE